VAGAAAGAAGAAGAAALAKWGYGGSKQSVSKQTCRKQSVSKQTCRKQSVSKQTCRKQTGRKQTGRKQYQYIASEKRASPHPLFITSLRRPLRLRRLGPLLRCSGSVENG
jgi:hypothetical protein